MGAACRSSEGSISISESVRRDATTTQAFRLLRRHQRSRRLRFRPRWRSPGAVNALRQAQSTNSSRSDFRCREMIRDDALDQIVDFLESSCGQKWRICRCARNIRAPSCSDASSTSRQRHGSSALISRAMMAPFLSSRAHRFRRKQTRSPRRATFASDQPAPAPRDGTCASNRRRRRSARWRRHASNARTVRRPFRAVRSQMFTLVCLVARKEDLVMRPLDHPDAVDLYEPDVVDQLQHPVLGQGAVRRIALRPCLARKTRRASRIGDHDSSWQR
jgi:hypothetical protein